MSDISVKIKGTLSRIKRVSQVLCCEFETLNPKKGGGVELKSTPGLENFVFLCSRSQNMKSKWLKWKVCEHWIPGNQKMSADCWFKMSSILFFKVNKCWSLPFIVSLSRNANFSLLFPSPEILDTTFIFPENGEKWIFI